MREYIKGVFGIAIVIISNFVFKMRSKSANRKMLATKLCLAQLLVAFLGLCLGEPIRLAKDKNFSRLINGKDATEAEFPYYAQLEVILSETHLSGDRTRKKVGYCGGSVIDDKHVLTAAHCLDDNHVSVEVTLGFYNIDDKNSQQKYYVESYEIHDEYNETTLDNDIAIITLADPIEFTRGIKPIQLGCAYTQPGTQIELAGRGLTSDSAKNIPPRLESVNLTTISNDVCAQRYLHIVSSKICAHGGQNKEGTCQGDSGAALIETVNGKQVQIAVVSAGDPDSCETGSPNISTRVSSNIEWIKDRAQITCSSDA